MDSFATIVSILYQFATNGAFLLLSALGLIVILGMMNIINLAHGELMMMGAYTASIAWHRGVPFWLCAILAFLVLALFGALLERTIVRRFYGRELGALVVTWGISLILSQGALMVFGPFLPAIPIPGGSIAVGQYSFSVYWLTVIALACVLIAGLWALYNHTTFGLQARAAMQNPAMARALGVDTGESICSPSASAPALRAFPAHYSPQRCRSHRSWASNSLRQLSSQWLSAARRCDHRRSW